MCAHQSERANLSAGKRFVHAAGRGQQSPPFGDHIVHEDDSFGLYRRTLDDERLIVPKSRLDVHPAAAVADLRTARTRRKPGHAVLPRPSLTNASASFSGRP